jgi:hypothetical protein
MVHPNSTTEINSCGYCDSVAHTNTNLTRKQGSKTVWPTLFVNFGVVYCYCSGLSTNGAVTSSKQDLEHVDMAADPPTASLKANTERIFANIRYAVNFVRIRIRRIL